MAHDKSRLFSVRDNTSLFRIIYIVDLILCQIGYIGVPAVVFAVFIFIWGLSLFTKKHIINFNIKKVNYYGWLLLFIAANIITVIIRGYDDGIWESLGMILNMPIIFFMFYGLHSEARDEPGKKRIYKEIYILSNVMMWLSFAANIFSLITLYYVGRSITYYYGYLVVYENRFTGIYYNPNLMAFTSFCSTVCCHILWQGDFVEKVTGKPITKIKRIIILLCAALNLGVIFLTDSNATALIIVCYTITYITYRLLGGQAARIGYILKRVAALILTFVFITAGIFCARYLVQTGTTQTMNAQEESMNVFEDNGDELNKITFEHENKNLDSGRIKLFKQGVNVIRHHPIFGVGKGNITKYGNRYNDNKMKYSDFHNGYLTIIVCSGFVGFIFFMGFAVYLGKRMAKTLFKVSPAIRSDIFPCLASFIAAYCVYSFFEKTLVFEISFMITFFWLILGYATVCMAGYEGDDYETHAFTSSDHLEKLINRKRLLHK